MEKMNLIQFREKMSELPVADKPPLRHSWDRHRYELHISARGKDPILTWSTLHATMFVGEAPFTEGQYRVLERLDRDRWMPATREDKFGYPPRLSWDEGTSGNLIHQAYHLAHYEVIAGKRVEEMDRICEFGGGYGAMCKLIRRLGFEGEYVIYDLPELSLIQQYYLSNVGIEFTPCVNANGLGLDPEPEGDLLIGLYSLTEAPMDVRLNFMSHPFPSYFFAHQHKYFGEILAEWSDSFMQERSDLKWKVKQNRAILSHRYMVGW